MKMEAELIWEKNLETKKVIRKELLKRRDNLDKEQREQWEDMIFSNLLYQEEYRQAKQILLYISYQSEVSTRRILEYCLEQKKKVYCPRVLSLDTMEYYEVKGLDDLKEGYRGIFEPVTSQFFPKEEEALMILPLTGFDILGNRLGYGKGYYDRYLKNYSPLRTIGLAFQCQLWNSVLPAEPHDKRLDKIITEKQVYCFSHKQEG